MGLQKKNHSLRGNLYFATALTLKTGSGQTIVLVSKEQSSFSGTQLAAFLPQSHSITVLIIIDIDLSIFMLSTAFHYFEIVQHVLR
jgi:hypothetical protein